MPRYAIPATIAELQIHKIQIRMKKTFTVTFLITALISLTNIQSYSQCNLTNATSCDCPNGQTSCDLLPDITISWYALESYMQGPTEYAQTGNGANDGKLRLTGSTPNIGWGPLTVRSQDDNGNKLIVCGTDTFTVPGSTTFTCPNGETPKQILRQRIYQKNGNTMTYREHLTPPMTYSNSSMYVDDWGIYSLRLEVPGEPNPRNWPIVGTGKKRAFCLMDYGSCTYYNGHCRDDNTVYQAGNIMTNPNFPNWGLGNSYSCSAVEQGISSGYTDIYSESLDGMWINIPPNTCNGDYWIFYEVDPHNYFEELDETNNFTLIPFTLTQQSAPGNPVATISSQSIPALCGNDSVILTASPGFSTLWSNGATTQSIKVSGGTYSVTVTNHCGTAVSAPFVVQSLPTPPDPVTTGDSICIGDAAVLQATGTEISWFDQNFNLVGTGNTFTTPPLTATTTYYARDMANVPGAIGHVGKPDSSGAGGNFTGAQYLIFSTEKPLLLKSVKVYSAQAGNRVIEVQNNTGQVIKSGTFFIPAGEYDVPLMFNLPVGNDLRITVNGNPNLWRNNSGVTYPYVMQDTLSITGSSAGASFYYFFYNWEVEVGQSSCTSNQVPAIATVDFCSGVNLENMDKMISLFPNPAGKEVNVEFTAFADDSHAEISIHDLSGRIVYSSPLQVKAAVRHKHTTDLSALKKGAYLVKITLNGKGYFRKLLIQ